MTRASSAVAIAVAVLLFPVSRAEAYVRSKTDNGVCLWWANPVGVPVVASVTSGPGAGGCGTLGSSSEANAVEGLIQQSLTTWSQATKTGASSPCTSFSFHYVSRTDSIAVGYDQTSGASNENLIVFRHGLCDGNADCGGSNLSEAQRVACADRIGCWPYATQSNLNTARTIAITTTSFVPSTGEILDADMELFDRRSSSDPGYYFTCLNAPNAYCQNGAPSTSCVSTDLGSIVTHEAGHMLGLDHSQAPSATMYATYVPGSVKLRVLDQDDVNGVCAAYPAGAAPTTCSASTVTPTPTPVPKSSGGCSTAGGGVLSMIGAAVALGRRRRGRASMRLS